MVQTPIADPPTQVLAEEYKTFLSGKKKGPKNLRPFLYILYGLLNKIIMCISL